MSRSPGVFVFISMSRAILLGLAICGGGLASTAQGAILSWSGGSGTTANWNDSGNWGFVGIPANGDTVIFSASQPRLLNTNNIAGLNVEWVQCFQSFIDEGGIAKACGSCGRQNIQPAGSNDGGTERDFARINQMHAQAVVPS